MPRVTCIQPEPDPALLWRMFPTWTGTGAVSVPDEAVERLWQRGWLKVEGERAVIVACLPEDCARCSFRVVFDKKYPHSHP